MTARELTSRKAVARKLLQAVAEAGSKVTLRDGRPWVADSPALPPGLLELLHAHAAEILAILREEMDWRGRRAQFYIHHGMVWGKERYDLFYRSYWRARALKLTYEDAVLIAFLDARPLREPFTLYEEPLPAWLQERQETAP